MLENILTCPRCRERRLGEYKDATRFPLNFLSVKKASDHGDGDMFAQALQFAVQSSHVMFYLQTSDLDSSTSKKVEPITIYYVDYYVATDQW